MGVSIKPIETTKPIYLKLIIWKRVIKITFSYQEYVDITYHHFQEIKLISQRKNIKLSLLLRRLIFFSYMSLSLLKLSLALTLFLLE